MVVYDTDINYKIFGEIMRPWGHEVRAVVRDDSGNHVHNICHTFKAAPTKEEITTAIEAKLARYKNDRDNPDPKPEEINVITEQDVVDFLIGRGCLEKGQKMDDLIDLLPATIEKPKWRKVWDYLISPAGIGF